MRTQFIRKARYQEMYELLEELKTEKTGFGAVFYRRRDIPRKIEILDRIDEIGTDRYICDLIPFTKDSSKVLREKTIEVIGTLLYHRGPKSNIYQSLMYCPIAVEDLKKYKKRYNSIDFSTLLIIGSLNNSGYTREYALREFRNYKIAKLIPYLLYRLCDWVEQVRTVAKRTLDDFLVMEYYGDFLKHLYVVEWLLKVKRVDLSLEYKKILDFITVENSVSLLEYFRRQEEKNRLILTKYILKQRYIQPEIIELFISDRNFLIRTLTAQALGKFCKDDLKQRLLNDKHSKVRLRTLYSLIKLNKITRQEWEIHLLDQSFGIRDLARFELRNASIDLKAFYKKHIDKEENLQIAILGLGEIEEVQEVDYLKKYLYHEDALTRQAAAISILKMDEYAIDDYLIEKLNSDDKSVKKVAVQQLSKYPDNETLDKIRLIYSQSSIENKIPILKLFSRVSGQRVYSDLSKALEEKDEVFKEMALKYFQYWERNSRMKYH